jgi:muconate cycloisomerase
MRARFNIESVEQPVAGDDIEGLRRVRLETGIPVMADESLCSLDDGSRLVEAGAADVFNIRVGKCGGLLGSLRLTELARASGLGVHLGALVGETAVLSRAAELFGRSVPGFACLEGKGQNRFLLEGDIGEEESGAPGLGVALRADWLAKYEQGRRELG